MGVRKNAARLTTTERDNFLRAILTLKNTIANPGAPPAQRISIYDQFVAVHLYTLSVNVPGGGTPVNMGHQNSGFAPWHRYYLLQFEQALQAVDPTVTLPYWDWTDHTTTDTIIFQDNFMGPNGGAGGGGGNVLSGYFAFNAPAVLPAWWPAGLPGWRIKAQLQGEESDRLRRAFDPFNQLETQSNVQTCLSRANYENPNGFRPFLETGNPGEIEMHNGMHRWVGGNMADNNSSPNDPVFFLHHCNVDRLWAMWQIDGHQGAAFYPAAGRPEGHNLNNLMWPWIGAAGGYSSNNVQPDIVLPNFAAQPAITPADMLDHRALGYAYNTEAILGIALDQTGSMTGMTPDPMTGMAPNIPKWEAAKSGISALLQDCEAAYTNAESYVVAGVETFRSLSGVNTFTQVFPGDHFGVVKNGGFVSQVNFDANMVGELPEGGTPLAGALTDTDTNLVRAPFGNLPAGEQRYLSILTDGKETAPPLLTSLGTPEFPDTVIFAMGFGIGGGWDGVDYGTIANMTSKGKNAPAGVAQVFHGENAAVIDKFFANTVAASIGYDPTSDPVFDLYPGEFVHYVFDVTDADYSLMITAQGFDYSDENWDFCLMAPDGSHCADTRTEKHDKKAHHEHNESSVSLLSPFLVTMKQNKGRCTIFLNRNGADAHHWVGRWALMASYKVTPDEEMMIMPAIADLILPVGAPPVKGPLYTRFNQDPIQRKPARAIPGIPAHSLAITLPGTGSISQEPPCAVAINIFNKTTHKIFLNPAVKQAFAGEDIMLSLDLSDLAGGDFDIYTIASRLVAPRYSLGNIFNDIQTISIERRKKYIQGNPYEPFNYLQYFADYESLKPGAFPLRDEIVKFEPNDNRTCWQAHIKNNIFPGVYRIGLYIEGTYRPKEKKHHDDEHCCEKTPQRFSRVLHTAVALGINPDEVKSYPFMGWATTNKFVVTITPADTLGNVFIPTTATTPVLIVNGQAVRAEMINQYISEYRMEVKVSGKFTVSRDGQSITEGEAQIETVSGAMIVIKQGENIKISIRIAAREFDVFIQPL